MVTTPCIIVYCKTLFDKFSITGDKKYTYVVGMIQLLYCRVPNVLTPTWPKKIITITVTVTVKF